MSFLLETQRLLLRPFELRDIHSLSEYRSDPEVERYQGWDAPFSIERARSFVAAMQNAKPGLPGDWYQVAIALRQPAPQQPGLLIGDCVFCLLREDPSQAEIGFTLARAYQGQGYAYEAVSRLLSYLFGNLGLHRVLANCDVQNHASARLMERLGMRREAHLIDSLWFKGAWASEYWYAILRYEWEQNKEFR